MCVTLFELYPPALQINYILKGLVNPPLLHCIPLLSLSGQILSPTFLGQWQVQTPRSFSEADFLNPIGNLDAFKETSTKSTYSGEVENESEYLATNNTNGRNREVLYLYAL